MTERGTRFDRAHEAAHEPGPEDTWQESVVVAWHDNTAGIGGYHRIGHEVHRGLANRWTGIIGSDGLRYRNNHDDLTLTDADRSADSLSAGTQTLVVRGPAVALTVDDPECALALDLEDFYEPCALFGHAGADVTAGTISNHFEGSGRVTGTLRWDGQTVDIDGFFHRDHSWGPRDWNMVSVHRWFAGTVGPDLSWALSVMRGWDGRGISMAGVVRDGELEETTDVDIVRFQEADGFSHRGGWARIGLSDGDIEITADAFDGVLVSHHDYRGAVSPCRMTTADGRVGGGIIEGSDGLRYDIRAALRAVSENGISRRA